MSASPRSDSLTAVCRALAWILLLACAAGQVWALYLLVPGEGEPFFEGQDKVAHAVIFGVPFAVALLLRSRIAVGLVIGHALVSEPLQWLLTSTRTADVWDLLADFVGIGLAAGAVVLARRTRPRARPSEGAWR